jgi:hypothetical protein
MRLTTIGSVRHARDPLTNVVRVPDEIRQPSATALERMLAV